MDVTPLLGQSIHGTDFSLAEWVDDGESSAGRPIAPLHLHRADDEAWYVLEGSLGFIRGDERLVAHAGAAVLVRAGAPHTFWNAGTGRCRYLIVLTPRVAALLAAIHARKIGEPGAPDDLAALFARFDSELLA